MEGKSRMGWKGSMEGKSGMGAREVRPRSVA
jgi:hypothetical protein